MWSVFAASFVSLASQPIRATLLRQVKNKTVYTGLTSLNLKEKDRLANPRLILGSHTPMLSCPFFLEQNVFSRTILKLFGSLLSLHLYTWFSGQGFAARTFGGKCWLGFGGKPRKTHSIKGTPKEQLPFWVSRL